MKFKYLIASAALVIGVAAYTLTLSFTETDLMSQLEALANGEDGESGGGESGGENPESGGTGKMFAPDSREVVCDVTVIERDLNGKEVNKYHKWVHVYLIKGCPEGSVTTTCSIQDCTAVSNF